MPIVIRKSGQLYTAEVIPPHGRGIPWVTARPLERSALIQGLRETGCHQTDIGDALNEADPDWLEDM